MRFFRLSLLLLCALFLFGGSALAYTMAEVGGLDPIVNFDNIGNSYASELAWLDSKVPGGVLAYSKYDLAAENWSQVDGHPTYFAISIDPTWTYFFVKLGTGGSDIDYDHWLYSNVANLGYAVVDISEWGESKVNIGRVSHIGAPVPEPATMLLLGSGLIGVAAFGRKRLFRKN